MDARPAQDQKREVVMTHGVLSEDPEDLFHGTGLRVVRAVLHEAVLRLWSDDAFGMAGNVAFRALLAIFPFLIFTSSLTAFVGDRAMAERDALRAERLTQTAEYEALREERDLWRARIEALAQPLFQTQKR